MPNECNNWIVIYGDGSHELVEYLYNKYSQYDGECAKNKKKMIGINNVEISEIKLYSSWNPIYEELVDLSKTYKLWIRNTYSIEYGQACQGLIVVENGNTFVKVEYFDYYDCTKISPHS